METHPQKAEDMPLGDGDLTTVVRTIDPILDQLYDGAIKGALHADDLVDIANRIRTILHEAVARGGGSQVPHGAASGRGSSGSTTAGALAGGAASAAPGGVAGAPDGGVSGAAAGDAPSYASVSGG